MEDFTFTKGSPNILTMTKQGYDSTCSKYLCDVSLCVCYVAGYGV
jgi:hypothetical protein